MIHRCAFGIGDADRPEAAPDRVYTNHVVGIGRNDQRGGYPGTKMIEIAIGMDLVMTCAGEPPMISTGQWVGQKGQWSLTGYGTKGGNNCNSSPVGGMQAPMTRLLFTEEDRGGNIGSIGIVIVAYVAVDDESSL